jgi:predicted PurR-regulated permease PerM
MRSEQILRIASITLAICSIMALLAVLWQLRAVIVLVGLAVGTSAALKPVLLWLTDRKVPKSVALGIVYTVLGLAAIAVPLALAVPVANEFSALADSYAEIQDGELKEGGGSSPIQRWIVESVPWVRGWVSQNLGSGDSVAFWRLLGFTWGAFEALGNVVIVFVLSIYWSADHEHFERLWLSLLSVERRAATRDLWKTIQSEIGAYLRSEAVQVLLAGGLLGLGYYLLGFPFPALLAILCAAAWLVPWGGIVIALAATAIFSVPAIISEGDHIIWSKALPVGIYTVVVLSVLEYFVEPRFFDRRRYNALLVLLVVIVLTESFGIAGLILAPLAAATLQLVGGFLVRRRAMQNATVSQVNAADQRIDSIWEAVEQIDDAPPELVNVLDRLARLSLAARRKPESLTSQT